MFLEFSGSNSIFILFSKLVRNDIKAEYTSSGPLPLSVSNQIKKKKQ